MKDRDQVLQIEETRKSEQEQRKRAPFFVIVGAPGVGKTELLGLMTESLGISPVDEKFVENKHLPLFYTSGHRRTQL